jgi:hypothetical protein
MLTFQYTLTHLKENRDHKLKYMRSNRRITFRIDHFIYTVN